MKRFLTLSIASVLSFAFAPADAQAGQTCVYVMGDIDGYTYTTPGYMIVVPDGSIDVDPLVVHVDETNQNILGYSVHVPGGDVGYDAPPMFVPGFEYQTETYSLTLQDLSIDEAFCLEGGVVTPAVPVYVPASVLELPGVFSQVPAIHFNLLGRQWSTSGQILDTDKETIVIPGLALLFPPKNLSTPDGTIAVSIDGSVERMIHLLPNR